MTYYCKLVHAYTRVHCHTHTSAYTYQYFETRMTKYCGCEVETRQYIIRSNDPDIRSEKLDRRMEKKPNLQD